MLSRTTFGWPLIIGGSLKGLSASPVRAIEVSPKAVATRAALTTFRERPEVLIAIKRSPRAP